MKLIDKIHQEFMEKDFNIPKDNTVEWEYKEIIEIINPTEQQVDDFIYNLEKKIYV